MVITFSKGDAERLRFIKREFRLTSDLYKSDYYKCITRKRVLFWSNHHWYHDLLSFYHRINQTYIQSSRLSLVTLFPDRLSLLQQGRAGNAHSSCLHLHLPPETWKIFMMSSSHHSEQPLLPNSCHSSWVTHVGSAKTWSGLNFEILVKETKRLVFK